MAPAAFWKGYLKFSFVNCPVSLTPATTQSEKVRFHTINKATGRRVRSRYVDAETGKPVKEHDEVKGYETEEGRFVTFENEELEAVALESVRTIDIESFVPADSIPWIYYDSPSYVTPSDKAGEEAFAVIREAMAAKEVVGVARLVMFRRERAVMLTPRDNGIILWTLRYGDEVREPDAYFKTIADDKSEPKLIKLITDLIEERSKEWTPEMVKDPVQDKLKELITSKRKKTGKSGAKKGDDEPDGREASNVVDLMSALKKSLENSEKKGGKK